MQETSCTTYQLEKGTLLQWWNLTQLCAGTMNFHLNARCQLTHSTPALPSRLHLRVSQRSRLTRVKDATAGKDILFYFLSNQVSLLVIATAPQSAIDNDSWTLTFGGEALAGIHLVLCLSSRSHQVICGASYISTRS